MEVTVTKLDVAKRQIETAIVLYFAECDPVSIHTLCRAGYDVIHALNKKRAVQGELKDMMLKDLDRFLGSKTAKREFHEYMNASGNFFKHASSDPTAMHTFDTRYTEALLFDAVQKYSMLVGECPKNMAIYLLWFLTQLPFALEEMPESHREVVKRFRRSAPNDRRSFYADYSQILNRYRFLNG